MGFPDTDWPGTLDSAETRADATDIIWKNDFEFQDKQVRRIQEWLGTTGDLIGEGIASVGPGGLASPIASGGTSITLAARASYAAGKLLSVGDDYDASYTEMMYLNYLGVLWLGGGLQLAATQAVDSILDEDDLSSDSDTALATQQSIKKYVDDGISGITHNDTDAIHKSVDGEINALTSETPTTSDVFVFEDATDTYGKKKATIGDLPAQAGADSTAIHNNVGGEINGITEKASPVDADIVVIEDSAASYAKKKVQLSNLTGSGGGGDFVGALNDTVTMGAAATELIIGQLTYDGSTGASHTFKAIIEPDAAVTCEIRLYDRGPVAGPPTAATVVSKLTTSSSGLQVLSLTLTASASPTLPDNDEIYNTDRMYEVRGYISGTLGDNLYVGKVSLTGA